MEPIRILHVVSSLSKGSGVTNMLMNFYRHIDKREIQFDFLFFFEKENSYQEEILSMGGRVYFFPVSGVNKILYLIGNIKKFFKEHKEYNVLHVHVPSLAWFVMLEARLVGIENRILHSHGTMYGEGIIKILRNFLFAKITLINANKYCACSNAAAKFTFGTKLYSEKRVEIIKNAIDIKYFKYDEEIRKRVLNDLNINGNLLVGHIGGFTPVKNHKFIVDIFYELKQLHKDSMLILIGDGPLIESIKEYAIRLKLNESILFMGSRSDISYLMQAMDVFILPSFKEGFPVVSIEAQAAGLPCIISDSVTSEIQITNLINFMNIKESGVQWAHNILSLVNRSERTSKLEEMKKSGFDVEMTVKTLEKYYKEMIGCKCNNLF